MGDEFGMRKLRDCYGQKERVDVEMTMELLKTKVRGEKKSRG